MKRIAAAFSALALLFTFTACGSRNGGAAQNTAQGKTQTMYKETMASLPEDYMSANSLVSTDGGMLLVYNDSAEKLHGVHYDSELNRGSRFLIEKEDSEWLSYFAETEDGGLRAFSSSSDEGTVTVAIKYFTADGRLTSVTELGDLDGHLDMDNIFINAVTFHNDDTLLSLDNEAVIADGNGHFKASADSGSTSTFTFDRDGGIICSGIQHISRTDKLREPSDKERTEYPDNTTMLRPPVSGDERFAAYLILSSGVYGMDTNGSQTLLVDFSASNIKASDVISFCPLGEGRFAMLTKHLSLLTVRPDSYRENRQTVVVGIHGTVNTSDYDDATDFARFNDDYRVEFRQYGYESDDLRFDILSGDSPDVYELSSHNDIYRYVNMDALADFEAMHKKYGGISENDFLPNVVSGMRYKGRLYSMTEQFSPCLYPAYNKVLSRDKAKWTYDEFYDFVAAMPEDMYISERYCFDDEDRLMSFLCMLNLTDWVNYEEAECYFDTPEFIRLLEFVRGADLIGRDSANSRSVSSRDELMAGIPENLAMLRNRKALFGMNVTGGSGNTIDSFLSTAAAHSMKTEELTLAVQPGKNRSGAFNTGGREYTVLTSGKCQQGGWAYLGYLFSYDRQMASLSPAFPTRQDAFRDAAENTFAEMNANDQEYTSGINGFDFSYNTHISRDEFDYVIDTSLSCDRLGSGDSRIIPIISEEFSQYIAGELSAGECAERIQNRTSLMLSEQS